MIKKILLWSAIVSAGLSVFCFTTHALTFRYDADTGVLHEPFFFMVFVGYVFLAVSFVASVLWLATLSLQRGS